MTLVVEHFPEVRFGPRHRHRGEGRIYHPCWTVNGVRHYAQTWRLDYSVGGLRVEKSAGTRSYEEAERLLDREVQLVRRLWGVNVL